MILNKSFEKRKEKRENHDNGVEKKGEKKRGQGAYNQRNEENIGL